MPIQHANSELVARAWLRTIPELPTNQIGTTLPQKKSDGTYSWQESGFVQVIVTGRGTSSMYYGYRAPVITAHCWAVNPHSQTPPWGKACDLAEAIHEKLLQDDNGTENLTLGVSGAPEVRVMQAWLIDEVKRIPWGFPSGQGSFVDPGDAAHYTIAFQLAWAELPQE